MLAACLVAGVNRLCEEYSVKNLKACAVASANSENYEILGLLTVINDLDLCSLYLKIGKVLNLREEEILSTANSVQIFGKLCAFLPFTEMGFTVIIVNGEIAITEGSKTCKKSVKLCLCNSVSH